MQGALQQLPAKTEKEMRQYGRCFLVQFCHQKGIPYFSLPVVNDSEDMGHFLQVVRRTRLFCLTPGWNQFLMLVVGTDCQRETVLLGLKLISDGLSEAFLVSSMIFIQLSLHLSVQLLQYSLALVATSLRCSISSSRCGFASSHASKSFSDVLPD